MRQSPIKGMSAKHEVSSYPILTCHQKLFALHRLLCTLKSGLLLNNFACNKFASSGGERHDILS